MPTVNDNNMRRFLAYGASIRTSLDLSPYLPLSHGGSPTLTVVEKPTGLTEQDLTHCRQLAQSHGRELAIYSNRDFGDSTEGQSWCFLVEDVGSFHWRGGCAKIHFEQLAGGSEELLAFWLIHIVLPLRFTVEGRYEFFHACSVEINDTPVLFTAPSMGGKSTLTDYFLSKGHGLVSDDKVAIVNESGEFFAVPSHPNHRPYRRFEDLGKRADRFFDKRAAIGAVYKLKRVGPDEDVHINEVLGHRKFAEIRPSYLFDFGDMKERRLVFSGAMADSLPVYEVDVPWNLEKLEEVYVGIREQFNTLKL